MFVEMVGVRDAVIGEVLRSKKLPESARAFVVSTLGEMEQRAGRALRVRISARVSGERTRFDFEVDEFDASNLLGKTSMEAL